MLSNDLINLFIKKITIKLERIFGRTAQRTSICLTSAEAVISSPQSSFPGENGNGSLCVDVFDSPPTPWSAQSVD